MLYQRLTGSRPFTEEQGLIGLMAAILEDERPDPREAAPHAPPGLCAIASRAIARQPEARYPDAGELARALRDWLDAARPSSLTVARPGRWSRPGAVALGLAVVLVAAGALWVRLASDEAPILAPPAPEADAPITGADPSPAQAEVVPLERELLRDLGQAPIEAGLLERVCDALRAGADVAVLRALSRRLRSEVWQGIADPRPMREQSRGELSRPLTRVQLAVIAAPLGAERSVAQLDLVLFRAYAFQDLTTLRNDADRLAAEALRVDPGLEAADAQLACAYFELRVSLVVARSMPLMSGRVEHNRARVREALQTANARGCEPGRLAELQALLERIEAL